MSQRPALYVLDAYSIIYQVFHAIPAMNGPGGQPTNAVFGIFRDVMNLLRNRRPDYLAAAFDGGGPVFRNALFPDYKGQRKEMPGDLRFQVPIIKRLFEAFRVPVLIQPGFEADDIIASLARRAAEKDIDVFICTADKDARQLLGDRIRIYNFRKDQVLDVAALKEDWGIRPDQVVDLLSLTGDAVDNVPGVPGVGLKTAAKLLEQFGDLETLLANVDKVAAAKTRANLIEHADRVRLGKKLIELNDKLPMELDWDALKSDGYDAKSLKTLCVECGFHRFLDEIVDDSAPPEIAWDTASYKLIDTPELLAEFVAELGKQPKVSVDTETTALDPTRAELVGLSFSWEPGSAYYLPVRGPEGSQVLDEKTTLDVLRPILTDPTVEKVGQNLKYDMLVLGRAGLEIAGPVTDTMVLSYLLESGERNHNLDELSRRLLDHTMIPIASLIGKGKAATTIDQVEVPRVTAYAGEDADAAWRLEAILTPKLKRDGLWELYTEVERPLIAILAKMERAGIKVDVDLLGRLSKEFAERLDVIRGDIYREAGREFNIGSAPQLRVVLFDELKLPALKKTPKGEPSTDAEVLEELAAKHPLPRLIVEHRQLDKLKSTYLDALPLMVHPEDGRVHASFNQVVAATGRLSSSDPNLQNIPVRTDDGRQIRQAFIPGFPEWSILTADYSQIELRVLAHYSKDPALVLAFEQEKDVHASVASRIFGVEESQVTSAQRRVAKTVNFGVIYGISPYGLSTRLGITQADAAAFIDAYFREFAGVASFITETLQAAQKRQFVETILGRRRSATGIKNTSPRNLNQGERIAVNAVIQGSAADMIKRAMLAVDRRLAESSMKSRLLLQIHDELLFEGPDDEMPALAGLVRHAMTHALTLDVPIGVDVSVGPNWLDVADVT